MTETADHLDDVDALDELGSLELTHLEGLDADAAEAFRIAPGSMPRDPRVTATAARRRADQDEVTSPGARAALHEGMHVTLLVAGRRLLAR
jgi:hypothetical protein